MKKILVLVVMVLVLASFPLFIACNSATPISTSATTKVTSTTSAAAATTAAISESQVWVLKYATDNPEVSDSAQFASHFMDYVEANSGGRVKFERYFGGVLGTAAEMLDFLSSGAVHMTNLLAALYTDVLPLHNGPHWQLESSTKALNYVNQLEWEIPETAAILDKECEESNIIIINYNDMGENGIMSREMFSSLADLKGKKLGSNMSQKALESMGLNIVSTDNADVYEALSRGVIDCTTMPLAPMVASKWYEPCKCFIYGGYYAAAQQTTLNRDIWNSFPDDLQQVFWDAGKSTEAFSIEFVKENAAKFEKIITDAGVSVGIASTEDAEALFRLNYDYQMEEMIECAKTAGKTAEAEVIKRYSDQITWGESN